MQTWFWHVRSILLFSEPQPLHKSLELLKSFCRDFYSQNTKPVSSRSPLCFVFVQMYGLIWLTQMPSNVQDCDVLVMLTSALCHDLDHPGYNNAYQVSKANVCNRCLRFIPIETKMAQVKELL